MIHAWICTLKIKRDKGLRALSGIKHTLAVRNIMYEKCMINVRICTLKGKRVIAGQCREGLYARPKTMFDRFSKWWWHFKSVVVFFRNVCVFP